MGNENLPSEQTTGIAGSAPQTTVNCKISNNKKCNKHVTPAPEYAIGTVNYYYDPAKEDSTAPWLSRHFDFLDRHQCCNHTVPEYYLGYGYKYINRFTEELYPKLSSAGKEWLINARRLLQEYMEDGFKQNIPNEKVVTKCTSYDKLTVTTKTDKTESLELVDSKFTEFAFNTHPPAYIDGGLGKLPLLDLTKISMTPDWGDLFSKNGRKQIWEIMGFLMDIKFEEAKKNPVLFINDHVDQAGEVADYYVFDPVKNTVNDVIDAVGDTINTLQENVNDTINQVKEEVEKKTGEIAESIVESGKRAVINEIKRRLNNIFNIPFPSMF